MKDDVIEHTRLTDEEILKIDFYDIFGSWAIWYTDEEKIKYYRKIFLS